MAQRQVHGTWGEFRSANHQVPTPAKNKFALLNQSNTISLYFSLSRLIYCPFTLTPHVGKQYDKPTMSNALTVVRATRSSYVSIYISLSLHSLPHSVAREGRGKGKRRFAPQGVWRSGSHAQEVEPVVWLAEGGQRPPIPRPQQGPSGTRHSRRKDEYHLAEVLYGSTCVACLHNH